MAVPAGSYYGGIVKPSGWFHLAIVIQGRSTGFTGYLDGVNEGLVDTLDGRESYSGSETGISIGAGLQYGSSSSVMLDELAIWTIQLSDDDIRALHGSYA